MAQMNVGMSLTLADTASAPLRAFTALVERLQVVVNGLAPRLAAVTAELSAIGAAAAGARGLGAFAAQTQALTGQLGALTGALGGATAGMAALGAAGAAGGAAMNQSLAQTNAHASSLHTTLAGIASLWAANKIKDGLVASATGAAGFETTQARATTAGLSAAELANAKAVSLAASQAVPQFDRDQALKMAMDLRSTMNDLPAALAVLPEMLRFAYVLKSQSPDGKVDPNILRDTGKFLQQRGAINDPEKRREEIDNLTRIITANPSVNVSTMLMNLSQMKGTISGDNVSKDFLPILASLAEMNPSKGGQIGTQLTTMAGYVAGIYKSGTSAKQANELGLMEDSKGLVFNSQGNINLQKSNLRMKGLALFQSNPLEWVEQVLIPAMQSKGLDADDSKLVSAIMARLMPARNAAELSQTIVNKRAKLRADAAQTAEAMGSEQQYDIFSKTTEGRWDAMTAKLRDIALVLGETMLPAIKEVAEALTTFLQDSAAWMEAHPLATKFIAWGAAIAAVGLALAGLVLVFGGLSVLGPMFSAIGVVILDVVAGIIAVIGGPLTLIIAALVLAWNLGLGDWLKSLAPTATTIGEWATQVSDRVVTAFANAWIRVKEFFGFIDSASANAEVNANNRARAGRAAGQSGSASGNWGDGVVVGGGGATGSWGGDDARSFRASDNYGARAARSASDFKSGTPGTTDAHGRLGGGGGRFKNYNADADLAENDFKREESAAQAEQKKLDAIYKQGLLSIADYYGGKQELLNVSVEMEIAILNREKAAFQKAGDMAGVNRMDTQLAAVKNKLDTETDKNTTGREQATAKLTKERVDLERALLMTSGQRHAAEALHLEEEIARKVRLLVKEKEITQEKADAFMASARAATQLKLHAEDVAKVRADYADKLAEVQNAERNGTLSQTAAEDQKLALLKEEAETTDVLLRQNLALAVASNNTAEQLRIRKELRQNDAIKGQLPADQIAFLKSAQQGFGNFFNSILSGTKSVKDAFRSLGHSILDSLNQVISKRLGDALFDSMFGAAFGAGGGGGFSAATMSGGGSGGGWLGSLVGSIFGGGSANAAGGAASSGFGTGAGFGNMDFGGFFASGIDNVPSDMLAVIHKGERVMTASDNARYTGSGGRSQINHINISPPAGMSKQSAGQLGATIAQKLALADRRHN